jgi:ABC-type Fe3+ transport system substrate-binding protein
VTELLVYASSARADVGRTLLASACAALGLSVRLEVLGTGALYQRLSARRSPPAPDLAWWFGPFAAQAAATDGLVQNVALIDASPVGVIGSPVRSLSDLATAPRLAMPDPERSEVGMAILLASLDAWRQTQSDAWAWWQQRASAGMLLAEDSPGAVAMAQSGAASHAVTLSADAAPLSDVPPIPHAVALAANSRNVADATRLLEWLKARATAPSSTLDINWCTQNYNATRERWAQSGFSPSVTG